MSPNSSVKTKEKRRNNEKRKEKSRDAARCRRSRETEIFTDLAAALPLQHDQVAQLDKASIMRLAISYLRVRDMIQMVPDAMDGEQTVQKNDDNLMVLCGSNNNGNDAIESFFLKSLEGFVLVLSNDGDFVYLSENVADYLGITQVDLMGQNIYEYSHPCDHDEIKEILSAKNENEGWRKKNDTGKGRRLEDPKSFFIRLKCTLTSKGRSVNLKSAIYKVIHCIGHYVYEEDFENDDDEAVNGADSDGNSLVDDEFDDDDDCDNECQQSQKGQKLLINKKKRKKVKAIASSSSGVNGDGLKKRCLIAIGQPIPHPSNIESVLPSQTFLTKHGLDMKFTYADEKMLEFLNYEPDDLIGKSVYEYHHAMDTETIHAAYKCLFSKGQCETVPYRFLVKTGGYVWVVTQATLIHDKMQKPQSVVSVNYLISGIECKDEIYSQHQVLSTASTSSTTITPSSQPLLPTTLPSNLIDESIKIESIVITPPTTPPSLSLLTTSDNNNSNVINNKTNKKRAPLTNTTNNAINQNNTSNKLPKIGKKLRKSSPQVAVATKFLHSATTINSDNQNNNKINLSKKVQRHQVVEDFIKEVEEQQEKEIEKVAATLENHSLYTKEDLKVDEETVLNEFNKRKVLILGSEDAEVVLDNEDVEDLKEEAKNRPLTATSKIFAPRTKEMNKGFLTFPEKEPGRTLLKEEPDDLTHLAPVAGDVCVPLDEWPPYFREILDDFLSPNGCSNNNGSNNNNIHSIIANGCSSSSSDSGSNGNNNFCSLLMMNDADVPIDPILSYRDQCRLEDSTMKLSPLMLSPNRSKGSSDYSLPSSLSSPSGSLDDDNNTNDNDQLVRLMSLQIDNNNRQNSNKDDNDDSYGYNANDDEMSLPLLMANDIMWSSTDDNCITTVGSNSKNHQSNSKTIERSIGNNNNYGSIDKLFIGNNDALLNYGNNNINNNGSGGSAFFINNSANQRCGDKTSSPLLLDHDDQEARDETAQVDDVDMPLLSNNYDGRKMSTMAMTMMGLHDDGDDVEGGIIDFDADINQHYHYLLKNLLNNGNICNGKVSTSKPRVNNKNCSSSIKKRTCDSTTSTSKRTRLDVDRKPTKQQSELLQQLIKNNGNSNNSNRQQTMMSLLLDNNNRVDDDDDSGTDDDVGRVKIDGPQIKLGGGRNEEVDDFLGISLMGLDEDDDIGDGLMRTKKKPIVSNKREKNSQRQQQRTDLDDQLLLVRQLLQKNQQHQQLNLKVQGETIHGNNRRQRQQMNGGGVIVLANNQQQQQKVDNNKQKNVDDVVIDDSDHHRQHVILRNLLDDASTVRDGIGDDGDGGARISINLNETATNKRKRMESTNDDEEDVFNRQRSIGKQLEMLAALEAIMKRTQKRQQQLLMEEQQLQERLRQQQQLSNENQPRLIEQQSTRPQALQHQQDFLLSQSGGTTVNLRSKLSRKDSLSLLLEPETAETSAIVSLLDLTEQDYEVNAPVTTDDLILQGEDLLNALESNATAI